MDASYYNTTDMPLAGNGDKMTYKNWLSCMGYDTRTMGASSTRMAYYALQLFDGQTPQMNWERYTTHYFTHNSVVLFQNMMRYIGVQYSTRSKIRDMTPDEIYSAKLLACDLGIDCFARAGFFRGYGTCA